MYEAVHFIERHGMLEPDERVLGEYSEEIDAIQSARISRAGFMETESDNYAWWIVRKEGARLANFIADSKSDKEFVLDLGSGELVEFTT